MFLQNLKEFDIPFEGEVTVGADAVGAGIFGVFFITYCLVLFLSFTFSIVCYVFQSIGLYTIADRRGIRHAWLAWLPVGNLWLLGSISDQYQYIAKGKIRNRRKVMLGLNIAVVGLYLLSVAGLVVLAITSTVGGTETGVAGGFLLFFFGIPAFVVLVVVLKVLQYIAYYDLFKSCEPENTVLYLVLSIIFPVSMPFFVFACRKKDLGMPPRKQPAPQQVVVPTVEVVVDPNVVEKVVIPTVEPVTEEGFAQPEEFEEE